MVSSFFLIRLYYTKFLKRFQGNHDIVIQIYYNFGQISAAAVSSRFSRRRLIDFLPRLLYNKTVQGAAPAAGKQMREILGPMKNIRVLEPVPTIRSALAADTREAITDLARQLAEA